MSYIKTISTKQLAELRLTELGRLNDLRNNLENERFNEYFPDVNTIKQAIYFTKNELAIIEKEIVLRDTELLTIKIDLKNNWGISFYENINFWEDWVYKYIEEDFGISINDSMKIEEFAYILKKHGYTFYEETIISNISNMDLIMELIETYKSK